MKTKKSWQEKLQTDHGLPKVEPIAPSAQARWGKGTMLVPAPREVDEAEAAGKQRITPYWRTLKSRGERNPKFPGGLEVLRARLPAEGHTVEVRGKRMFVVDHEQRLVRPEAE